MLFKVSKVFVFAFEDVAFINFDKSSSFVDDLLFKFLSLLFIDSVGLLDEEFGAFFFIKEKFAFFFGFSSFFSSSFGTFSIFSSFFAEFSFSFVLFSDDLFSSPGIWGVPPITIENY